MDVEAYINQKVKLFKNKTYFKLFQTILINSSKNISIYKKQYSLSGRMDKHMNNNDNKSLWFYIMKIVLDKLKNKEKNFFIKNNLDVNPLVFSYLVKLSKIKIARLMKLSIIENAPMDNLIRLYFDLCQKASEPNEIKVINEPPIAIIKNANTNNNKSIFIDKNTQNQKQMRNALSFNNIMTPKNHQEEDDTNENNVKKKYGIGKLKLTYNRSLCRLFIGDTDEKSVQKKHLMSITVKKDRTLKINGKLIGKSEAYARRIINEIGEEKNYIDDDLNRIINKFKKEQKFLDEYKKNLKNEQNDISKKSRSIKLINLNSPKKNDANNFKTVKNKPTNKIFKTLSKMKKIKIKKYPQTPVISRKIAFNSMNKGKRKINKIKLDKFKKLTDRMTNPNYNYELKNDNNQFSFGNYFLNKKDFFYNDDFGAKF